MNRGWLGLGMLGMALLGACAGAAQAVRPTPPSASAVLDSDGDWQCQRVGSFGEPLVVDWQPHQRADLEDAMRDGVAVVSYDCHTLRMLHGCSVDGSYGFRPVSLKESVVSLKDEQELRVNLPSGLLGPELKSALGSGMKLDIALMMTGKRSTTIGAMARSALRGGAACEGATHFVKAAFVGAFAIGTSSRGEVSSAASIFGSASGESTRSSETRDGRREACVQLAGDASGPSEACSAILRVELQGIDQPVKGELARSPCPDGLQFSGGKCERASGERPHLCLYGDANDCRKQCDAGEAESCVNLGGMYRAGDAVSQDRARAVTLFKRSCDLGDALGCFNYGVVQATGDGVPKNGGIAASALGRACQMGSAEGCSELGLLYAEGAGVAKSPTQATYFLQQGCSGGSPTACGNLGLLYASGDAGEQDPELAAMLFKKGCDGGLSPSCHALAASYAKGQGLAHDDGRALALFKRACSDGYAKSCLALGHLHASGTGTPVDDAQAALFFERACDGGDLDGCGYLGVMYGTGRGRPKDDLRAASLFERACSGGVPDGCEELAALYEKGSGVKRDLAKASELYERACRGGDNDACPGAKRLGARRQ